MAEDLGISSKAGMSQHEADRLSSNEKTIIPDEILNVQQNKNAESADNTTPSGSGANESVQQDELADIIHKDKTALTFNNGGGSFEPDNPMNDIEESVENKDTTHHWNSLGPTESKGCEAKDISKDSNESEKLFFITENDNDEYTEQFNTELKKRRSSSGTSKKSVNWCFENEVEMERIKQERRLEKKTRRIMWTLYALAFLSSFSYWVQSGVLPYLTRNVGMTPELFGLMESSFAFYQMVTSPLYGRLGDVFGVRILYILSELSASISFGSLAIADSVPALFLTRLPALFMHSVLCAYMILTDISTSKSRADLIGKLGVMHGVGMIFGSLTGGFVTHTFDEKTAAIVAAISNLFSIFIIFAFIPDNTKEISYQINKLSDAENPAANRDTAGNVGQTTISGMLDVLKAKNIKYLLFVKILIAFPFSLLYSMFSMAVMDFYHLGPKINGILLGYIGVLTIVVQGLLVGYLTTRFTDAFNVKTMICFNALGFLFLVVAHSVFILVIVVCPLVIGGTVSHIVLMAVITKIVPTKDTGTALGLLFSLHAIVRAVAPTLGGLMFTKLGWPYFGVVGYAIHFILVGYVFLWGKDTQYE